MKYINKDGSIRVNLTLDVEFYEKLKKIADENFLPVSTYVKQQIMKQINSNED
jgi:predicted DNA-binding protein